MLWRLQLPDHLRADADTRLAAGRSEAVSHILARPCRNTGDRGADADDVVALARHNISLRTVMDPTSGAIVPTTLAPLRRRSRLHQESIAGAEKEKAHPPANATGLPGGDYSALPFP